MVDEPPPAPPGEAPAAGSILQRALGPSLRLLAPMAPRLFALMTFLAGTALLVSGALPGDPERLAMLGGLVPQPLIELSHFTGSLVGMALLLLARSLDWRIGAAWSMTVGLLAVGVFACLFRGPRLRGGDRPRGHAVRAARQPQGVLSSSLAAQ